MFDLFGSGMPLAARFFIAFLVVLALIGLTAWLVRRFGANRLGGAGGRGRQPRLAVIDAASIDGRRRLVLIRRDNIEHLLMIGGPTDVVIEPNIVRAAPAREPARSEPNLRAAPPASETSWPLQPSYEPPAVAPAAPAVPVAPVAPPRSYRASATEEPWLPPEPGARPRPADSLTGFAAELSSKFAPPEVPPPAARHEPRHEPPAPVPPPLPTEPPPSPHNDRNLAEMAQQLEAALRRAPEGRPPVTDPFAVPPVMAETPRAPLRDVKPRAEPKFETRFEPKLESKPEAKLEPKFEPKFEPKLEPEPKPAANGEPKPEPADAASQGVYDNLEEEMASLLGRPPGKS
jgi:flagellar protein FliO/FliZ